MTAVTVLGVGNPIMGDDGVGIELLRRVRSAYAGEVASDNMLEWAPRQLPTPAPELVGEVAFIDGGTAGIENLDIVQDAENLLLLDALAGPGSPGSVVSLEGDQIPRLLHSKLSPHQVGLLDLLSAARLLGREPARVAVVGIVAADCQLNVGMTEPVLVALPAAVSAALEVLHSWVPVSTST